MCRSLKSLSLRVMRKQMRLAKEQVMFGEGFVAQATSENCSAREIRGVRSLAVCRQLSLFGGGMERL